MRSNKKFMLFLFTLLLFPLLCTANKFYIDPSNGSMDNDGSISAPWLTFEAVIGHNLIESYTNSPLPYDPSTNVLKLKNQGAPIKAGDTLILNSGLHGNIFIRNYNNLDYITIMGGENQRPFLKKLQVQTGSKWRFENLVISSEPYGEFINSKLVFFESHSWHGPSKLIEIYNCEVISAENPWDNSDMWLTKVSSGIHANGDSINVINNEVRNIDMGISAVGDYINVVNNSVINFSGDGLRILGSYGVFQGNLIKNCYNVDDNHDDGIQSFTTNGYVVDHNVVRGNIIINNENPDQPLKGPLQGIGCFDGFYNNWTVENNLINVNHWHGITFLGAKDCNIINNTVLDPSPEVEPGGSWIRIANHKDGRPSSGCIVKNNVANQFTVDGEHSNNYILNNLIEYDEHFVDPVNFDFQLLAGSELIDSADDVVASMIDLNGIIRPQGDHSDIGCYEYTQTSISKDLLNNINSTSIFPNPIDNQLNLSVVDDLSNYSIALYNVLGEVILTENKAATPIYFSDLKNGIYYLKITNTKTDKEEVHRVIKK